MEKVRHPLSSQSTITILSLLKNFYDEDIFRVLIKEFYNPDVQVSLAAMKASASLGNELAIPHLQRILEKGNQEQKITAIKTYAAIKAPSSIHMLLKYFNVFHEKELRLELLKALNTISPLNDKIQQLNRQIVNNIHLSIDLRLLAVQGLLEAKDINFLKGLAETSFPEVKEEIFRGIIDWESEFAVPFIEYFIDKTDKFSPTQKGFFLASYLIHFKRPLYKLILDTLKKEGKGSIGFLLKAILDYNKEYPNPFNIFKALLILPYFNKETEALNGDSLEKIIVQIKDEHLYLLNELSVVTVVHLETLYNNLKKNFISLSGVTQKDMLLIVIFANLIERYGNQTLLLDIKEFLRGSQRFTKTELIENIKMAMHEASDEEKNRFYACLPLFQQQKKSLNLQVINILNRIDFSRPIKLQRLNRFVRLVGILRIKNAIKLLQNILDFARKEHIPFLEETIVVALCQLYDKSTIDQAEVYFSSSLKETPTLKGYIRGVRFLEPNVFIRNLVDLLLKADVPFILKDLIIESLAEMELDKIKGIHLLLMRLLLKTKMQRELKEKLAGIIKKNSDPNIFQLLLDLVLENDIFLKSLSIDTLLNIALKDPAISRELLINRFYLLLDDKDRGISRKALIALLSLKDDYAIEVLSDYFKGAKLKEAPQILKELKKPFSYEVISLLLKAILIDNKDLQITLEKILSDVVNGSYAEQIRNALLELLKLNQGKIPETTPKTDTVKVKENTLVEKPKQEFIFKRENTQILTVLFIDIEGYTEKSAVIDSTTLITLIKSFENIVIPGFHRFKGLLIKNMGDGMLSVFKHPLNAVIAALDIQKNITAHNQYKVAEDKFNVRIGINTGVVIRKQNDIFGDVVNIASRLETAANPGDILISYSTYNEIKDYVRCTELGKINVKGKQEPITAYLAEALKVNYEHLLNGKATVTPEVAESKGGDALLSLQQSLFSPNFAIPGELRFGRALLEDVGKHFADISNAVEEIAWDYQEEYEFKTYLQSKWKEILASWQRHGTDGNQNIKVS
jgi:class 3 adenylate cyclase